MRQKNLIVFIIVTFASIALFAFTFYAWYTNTEKVSDMSFDILQIDSLVSMYQANDDNYNGIPNLLNSEDKDKYYNPQIVDGSPVGNVPYSNQYHHENYSFNYVDQKYALSRDSVANLLNTVTLNNVAPSKVYGFKYEITNYIGSVNTLDLTFDEDDDIDVTKLSNFETRVGSVDIDGVVTFTEWKNFVVSNSYSGIVFYQDGLTVPASSHDIINDKTINGRLDVWLQIRVKAESTTTVTDFTLPEFRIKLSADIVSP